MKKSITDYNIGFINPPSPFLTDQRVFMSLGILRVATSLKEHTDKVFFLDLSGEEHYNNLISDFIETNNIDVICFTSTTPQKLIHMFHSYTLIIYLKMI